MADGQVNRLGLRIDTVGPRSEQPHAVTLKDLSSEWISTGSKSSCIKQISLCNRDRNFFPGPKIGSILGITLL